MTKNRVRLSSPVSFDDSIADIAEASEATDRFEASHDPERTRHRHADRD